MAEIINGALVENGVVVKPHADLAMQGVDIKGNPVDKNGVAYKDAQGNPMKDEHGNVVHEEKKEFPVVVEFDGGHKKIVKDVAGLPMDKMFKVVMHNVAVD